jgi:2-phospho-L-lactate/phosphoenolpyruvate guanylyltransferase
MWAVVPFKSPSQAKSRLAGVLTPAQRRALLFALGRRAIEALQATAGIERIVAVTASDEVRDFVARLGVETLLRDDETGTAPALCAAQRLLCAQGARRLLMLAGDLPLVTPAALRQLIDAADTVPGVVGVVVVPDRHRRGTNALLCTPADAIPPCFGVASLSRHLAAAAARGLQARQLEIDALMLDLDDADDLAEFARRGAAPIAALPPYTSAALAT